MHGYDEERQALFAQGAAGVWQVLATPVTAFLLIATVFVGSLNGRLEYGAPKQSDVIAAREGYVVGFNDATHCPDWTVYRLTVTISRRGRSSARTISGTTRKCRARRSWRTTRGAAGRVGTWFQRRT